MTSTTCTSGRLPRKRLAVALLRQAVIEHDDHTGVRLAADQPAETLAELEDGLRQVEALEPAFTGLLTGAAARLEQRVLSRERQLRDDQADERVAGEVLPRPQRVHAEEDGLGMAAELLG